MGDRAGAARTRRRTLLLLAVALVCGALAAAEVRKRERSVEERLGPALPVLVAARNLPAKARLTRADVAVRRVPARFVPLGALRVGAGAVGAAVAVPVPAGSYLTAALFAGTEEDPDGGGLARDERAVTVEVAAEGLGALAPGARVDVLVSSETGRTSVALTGAELLALAPAAGAAVAGAASAGTASEGTASTVPSAADSAAAVDGPVALATLRVTLQDAIRLTAADNFAREIRLLARPVRGSL